MTVEIGANLTTILLAVISLSGAVISGLTLARTKENGGKADDIKAVSIENQATTKAIQVVSNGRLDTALARITSLEAQLATSKALEGKVIDNAGDS